MKDFEDRAAKIRAAGDDTNFRIKKTEAQLASFCWIDVYTDESNPKSLAWDAITKRIFALEKNVAELPFAQRAEFSSQARLDVLIEACLSAMEKQVGIR